MKTTPLYSIPPGAYEREVRSPRGRAVARLECLVCGRSQRMLNDALFTVCDACKSDVESVDRAYREVSEMAGQRVRDYLADHEHEEPSYAKTKRLLEFKRLAWRHAALRRLGMEAPS